MSKIDTAIIKRLKDATGVGLTDAKKALENAKGDYEKALEAMRIKGLARAAKKLDRTAGSGLVHGYVHGNKIGVLVELKCETDFVARTDDFKSLANDLALHIAASAPEYVAVEDVPEDVVAKEQSLIKAELAEQGKPKNMWDKIAAGKLEKFYDEICLLRQPFVKDPNQTVGELVQLAIAKLGENIVIRRFARLELGTQE